MASNKIDYFSLKTFSEKLVKKTDINTKEENGLVPATKGQVQPHVYATNENGQPGWIPSNLVQTRIPDELLSVINGPSSNAPYKIWGTNYEGIPGWMSYSNNNSEDQSNPIASKIYNNIWYWWVSNYPNSDNRRVEFYFLQAFPTSTHIPQQWSFKYSVEVTVSEFPYPYQYQIYDLFRNMNLVTKSIIEVKGIQNTIISTDVQTICYNDTTGQIFPPDKNSENGDVYSSLFSYHVRLTDENKFCRYFGISFLNNIATNITATWPGNNPLAINYERIKKRIVVKLLKVNNCNVNLFDSTQYQDDGHGYIGQDRKLYYNDSLPSNLFTYLSDNSIGNTSYKNSSFCRIYNRDQQTNSYIIGTNIAPFKGATSSSMGQSGLVPTPATGDQVKFLKGNGTWSNPLGCISVAPNTNLDTLTTPGMYGIPNAATAASLVNAPPHTASGYVLLVMEKSNGGAVNQFIFLDGLIFTRGQYNDGFHAWQKISVETFTSATSSQDGMTGLVPAPSSTWYNTQANRFLRADGAWAYHPYAPSSTNYSFVPKAISGTMNLATSAYVLTGAGWKSFVTFDNVQPATKATGTTPGAHGVKGLVPAPNSSWFTTGAQDPTLIYLSGVGTWRWTNTFISDNLTDTSTYKALSARMGSALAGRFDSSYTVDANSTVSIPIRANCRALLITVGTNVNTLGLYILWTNPSGTGIIKTITAHTTLTLDLNTAKQLKATAGSAGCRFYFINLSGNNDIHEV